jgi:Mn-dependent DtxR family transcriptional regulator
MLKQLLALLDTGGTWRVSDLAAALGTSPDLVNAMLSHLEQSGKLDLPQQRCSEACSGCSLQSTCETEPTSATFVYVSHAPKSRVTT